MAGKGSSKIKWTLINVNNMGSRELHVARRNSHNKVNLLSLPSKRQDPNKKPFGSLESVQNSASKETASCPSLPQITFRNKQGSLCQAFVDQFDAFLVKNGEFTRTLNEISIRSGSESLVKIINCLLRSEGFSEHKPHHHHKNGTDKRDQLEFLTREETNHLEKVTKAFDADCKSVENTETTVNKIQPKASADEKKSTTKRKLDQNEERKSKLPKREEVVRKVELESGLEDAFQSKYLGKAELSLDELHIHPVFETSINHDRVKQIEQSMNDVYNYELTITVIPKEPETDLIGDVTDKKKEYYVISGSKAVIALKNLKKNLHPIFGYDEFKVSAVVYKWEGCLVAHYGKIRSNFVASETPSGGINVQDFVYMLRDFLKSRMTKEKAKSAISKIMLLTKKPPEQIAAMEAFCKSSHSKIEKMCQIMEKYETFNTTDVSDKLSAYQRRFANDHLPLPVPVKTFVNLTRIPENLFEEQADSVLKREISVKEMVEINKKAKDIESVEQQVCSLLKVETIQEAKENHPKLLDSDKLLEFRKSIPPKNNLKSVPRLRLEKYVDSLKPTQSNSHYGNIEMKETENYCDDLLKQISEESNAVVVPTNGESKLIIKLIDLCENSEKENQSVFFITSNSNAMIKVIQTAQTRKRNASALIVLQFLKQTCIGTPSLIKENLSSLIILGNLTLIPGDFQAFYRDPIEDKLTDIVSKIVQPGKTVSVLSSGDVKYKMDVNQKVMQSCNIVYYGSKNSLSKLRKELSDQTIIENHDNPFTESPVKHNDHEKMSMPLNVSPNNSNAISSHSTPKRLLSPRMLSLNNLLTSFNQNTPKKTKPWPKVNKTKPRMVDKENIPPPKCSSTAMNISTPGEVNGGPVIHLKSLQLEQGSVSSNILSEDSLKLSSHVKESNADLQIKDIRGEVTCNLSCIVSKVIDEDGLILRVQDGTESTLFSRCSKREIFDKDSDIDVFVTHPDVINKVDCGQIKVGSRIKLVSLDCKYYKNEDSQGLSMDYVDSNEAKQEAFQFVIESVSQRIDGVEVCDNRNLPISKGPGRMILSSQVPHDDNAGSNMEQIVISDNSLEKPNKRPEEKKNLGRQFLSQEAGVSRNDSEDDEEEDDNEYDDSFVDDASQSSDDHEQYLRSIRSPTFKHTAAAGPRKRVSNTSAIYSQASGDGASSPENSIFLGSQDVEYDPDKYTLDIKDFQTDDGTPMRKKRSSAEREKQNGKQIMKDETNYVNTVKWTRRCRTEVKSKLLEPNHTKTKKDVEESVDDSGYLDQSYHVQKSQESVSTQENITEMAQEIVDSVIQI